MEEILLNAQRLGSRVALRHVDGRVVRYGELVRALPGGRACVPVVQRDKLAFVREFVSAWAAGRCAAAIGGSDADAAERVRQCAEADAWPDARLVLFTSGTTGAPKGAVHTRGSLDAQLRALHGCWAWRADDAALVTLPLTHIHGLVTGVLAGLAAGATVVLAERFSARLVLRELAAGRASVFTGVPAMYASLLSAMAERSDLDAGGAGPTGFSSWRNLAQSGQPSGTDASTRHTTAAAPAERDRPIVHTPRLFVSGSAPLGAQCHQAWTRYGPPILERYGSTEAGIVLSNTLARRTPGRVGWPLGAGTAVRVDPGTSELLVSGPTLFAGYLGGRRVPRDADGFFRTGDAAEIGEAGVAILGRLGDALNVGGTKVHPVMVESAIEATRLVAEACVVGARDATYGQVPVLVYVARPGGGDVDLRGLCGRLADEGGVPPEALPRRAVRVAALPRNALGKLDRRALLRDESVRCAVV